MCELFTMSSSISVEVSFSLEEFSKHGGLSDKHKDGWGIAYYDDNDARIIKEACSASSSTYLEFVKTLKIKSKIIISHIRLATTGEVSIRNTQPFARELGGRLHVFTHNGELGNIEHKLDLTQSPYKPIGKTDSEIAFCYLMQNMEKIWKQGSIPNLEKRYQVFKHFSHDMSALGIANFIYSDSEYTFVHSHKRMPRDGKYLPGLFMLCRQCNGSEASDSIRGLDLYKSKPKNVVLIASVPLSNEEWLAIPEGEVKIIRDGSLVSISHQV